jgi:hypothetical protein
MDSTRLFNLLVLHGSLLAVGGCDDDEGEPPVGEETGMDPDPDDDDEPAATASSSSTSPEPEESSAGPESSTGEDDPSTSAASTGESESEASTGTPGEESSEGPPLECSEPAAADDTCGCPCCWAGDPSCINTDEVCCAGFTSLCTPP